MVPVDTTIQIHRAMGLSDEEKREIIDEISKLLDGTETITDALGRLLEVHDARTLLVGMKFMQLIQLNDALNNEVPKAKRRGTLTAPADPNMN